MKYTKMYGPDGKALELVVDENGGYVSIFGLPEGSELVEPPKEGSNVKLITPEEGIPFDPSSLSAAQRKILFNE